MHGDLQKEVEQLRHEVMKWREKGSRKRGPDATDSIEDIKEEAPELKQRRIEIQKYNNRVCIIID
jgi:hypothetical protein